MWCVRHLGPALLPVRSGAGSLRDLPTVFRKPGADNLLKFSRLERRHHQNIDGPRASPRPLISDLRLHGVSDVQDRE
jgi:hypothetical protein